MTGRKLIPIDLKKVENFASRGLSQAQIAAALGVAESTVQDRVARYQEFRQALANGRAKGIAQVANKLFEACMRGEGWAICFYLKTVGGYQEKPPPPPTSKHVIQVIYDDPPDR